METWEMIMRQVKKKTGEEIAPPLEARASRPQTLEKRGLKVPVPGKVPKGFAISSGFTAAAILLLLFTACTGGGGGYGSGGRLPFTTVSISPEKATVKAGESVTLTVTVSPLNTEFTVSASGYVTINGNRIVYTPPAVARTYPLTVTAGPARVTAEITVLEINDVDIPDDSVSNEVNGINDNGRILVEIIDPQGHRTAYLADRNGGNRTPVSPPGGGDVYVFGINNSNNVLGRSGNGYFLMRTRAGRIEYVTLTLDGHPEADFTGLNNAGQLVGYYMEPDGSVTGFMKETDASGWIFIRHPDVNYEGCSDARSQPCGTYITGINNTGLMAGYYIGSDGIQHGFILDDNGFTPIEHPNPRPGNPINIHVGGINDNGKVVGAFWGADFYAEGFIADGNDFTSISHPDATPAENGGFGTFFTGINNSNQITGWYDDGFKQGFWLNNP